MRDGVLRVRNSVRAPKVAACGVELGSWQIACIDGAGQSRMGVGRVDVRSGIVIPVDDRVGDIDAEITLVLCTFRTSSFEMFVDLP